MVKNISASAGNTGSIPGLGRSPRVENGNLLQYSCLENSGTEEPGGPQSVGSQRVRRRQLLYVITYIDAFELWCWRRLLRVRWIARRSNQSIQKKSVLIIHWKDWCWNWNSNTLATWCDELTHLKRPWYWKRLKAGGEGDNRVWDGWMASQTQWTWVWVNSGSWWWTGRPIVLQSMGSQRVRQDWVTELNWAGRNARSPQVARGNKLQVADVFFPS